MEATTDTITKTETREVTFLGRRAVQTIQYHERSKTGLRTILTEWVDDASEQNGSHPAGTVCSRTIRGDFRKATGVIVTPDHVVVAK